MQPSFRTVQFMQKCCRVAGCRGLATLRSGSQNGIGPLPAAGRLCLPRAVHPGVIARYSMEEG